MILEEEGRLVVGRVALPQVSEYASLTRKLNERTRANLKLDARRKEAETARVKSGDRFLRPVS
jgi:sensor domain CHASE-containing protein